MATPVETWLPGMDITASRLNAMAAGQMLIVTQTGADPTGGVNSAPGIQSALDQARAQGGGWVLVPPGRYLIGATLRIYSNTRLTLMAGAEFRRNIDATMIINGDAGQNNGSYSGHSRIVIEGGLWNMRGTTAGLTGDAMCISIGHATDIVIKDLEIRDVPGFHGVELNSTTHGLVSGCQFRGYVDNTADHSRDFSEAVQIDLAKGADYFGGFGPYDHTPCADILITGCHFGASATAGTTAWPRGVGSHSATITKWHRRVRISDNSFEGILQYAISAYNWEDTTVTGNTFVSCGSGVRIRSVILTDTEDTKDPSGTQTNASQNMRNTTVTGNSFRSGGGYDDPIVALGETSGAILNLAITGNTIDGSTASQNGVRLQRVDRATIGDNVIANVDGTGLSTEDSNNLTFGNNQIWTPGANGITFVNASHCSAVGNQIRDPGNSGILIQAGTDIHLRDNYIKSPGRSANATYYGIRVSTTGGASGSISLSGNKVRPAGSGAEAVNGLSIQAGVTNVHRYGNDWRGTTFTGTPQADSSTTPNTTATDLS